MRLSPVRLRAASRPLAAFGLLAALTGALVGAPAAATVRAGAPVVIAHRGYSAVAPENTLAAVEAARRLGVGYVEIDAHTTRDGVPVVLHDQTVDRTTDGTGDVAKLSSRYLRRLDAGSWFSPAFARQPLPTLDQVLDLLKPTPAVKLLLEIKGPETYPEVARMTRAVTSRGMTGQVLIQSFDKDALRHAKKAAPAIPRAYLTSLVDADPVAVSRELDLVAYNPSIKGLRLREGAIEQLHQARVQLMVWTVDRPADWRWLRDRGVEGFITNQPGQLLGWAGASG